ncbi:MAG: hypothetical protein SGPRY_002021 [Prymnesium sp.]
MLALLLGALHCASGLAPIARTSPLVDGCPRAASPLSASSSSLPPSFARRSIFTLVTAASVGAFMPLATEASGGATAGKYTTIPIAKRRYFGRVKQGVYEFTLLGDAVKKGDLKNEDVSGFFAQTIKTQSARQKSQCAGGACEVKEEFSSRWEVKQVKEAKAFFAQVEKLQIAARTGDKKAAALRYADAIDALEIYLNDVELPPTDNQEYQVNNDMTVPSLCQGSFCI